MHYDEENTLDTLEYFSLDDYLQTLELNLDYGKEI